MRIIKNIKKNLLKTTAVSLLLAMALPAAAYATSISAGGSDGLPHVKAGTNTVTTIMSIAFIIIGSFALLNITLSGFKYITSAGDPQKASEARNGIVFSVLGLMIAIAAEAIVVFVVKGVG